MSTSANTVLICGCCGETTTADVARLDVELQAHVCPDCRTRLMVAKAVLAQPCDGGGRRIAIKGCTQHPSAPDNL